MTTILEREVPIECAGEIQTLTLIAHYDSRLRKTVRWSVQGDAITVRIPPCVRRKEVDRILEDVISRVRRDRDRARQKRDRALQRQDADLQARARALNRLYFDGELTWRTIRWVGNMQRRLGSCTNGGPTDGDIRLSERIRSWPSYVVDYVIAHELAHRKFPNHSSAFWAYLARYPHMERARGFIEGVAFADGAVFEEDAGLAPADLPEAGGGNRPL